MAPFKVYSGKLLEPIRESIFMPNTTRYPVKKIAEAVSAVSYTHLMKSLLLISEPQLDLVPCRNPDDFESSRNQVKTERVKFMTSDWL